MGNSPVEHANRTIVQWLVTAIVESLLDWDEIVPSLLLTYSTTYHNSIGNTPYELMYGRKCSLPSDSPLATVVLLTMADNAADQALNLKASWEAAKKIIAAVQEKNKQQYDRTAKPHKFKVGQKVLYKDHSRASSWLGKLAAPFSGPFVILKLAPPNVAGLGLKRPFSGLLGGTPLHLHTIA